MKGKEGQWADIHLLFQWQPWRTNCAKHGDCPLPGHTDTLRTPTYPIQHANYVPERCTHCYYRMPQVYPITRHMPCLF